MSKILIYPGAALLIAAAHFNNTYLLVMALVYLIIGLIILLVDWFF